MSFSLFALLLLASPSITNANSICESSSGFSQEIVARWCGKGKNLNSARPRAAKPKAAKPLPAPIEEIQEDEAAQEGPRSATRIQETDRPGEPGTVRNCTPRDKERALDLLRREHPEGYRLVKKDLKQFREDAWWQDCANSENFDNLIVALHETVHGVSFPEGESGRENYPLIEGKQLKYLDNVGFFPPHRAGAEFPNDTFKDLYFTNKPDVTNSAQEFPILLDELNAYTHGLHAANVLHKHDKSRQWRAGAVALMSFVKAYITKAGQGDASDMAWQRLNEQQNRRTIQALYFQAENVVTASCRFPSDGQDRWYLAYLCKDKGASLERVLGRKPVCFAECGAKPRERRRP